MNITLKDLKRFWFPLYILALTLAYFALKAFANWALHKSIPIPMKKLPLSDQTSEAVSSSDVPGSAGQASSADKTSADAEAASDATAAGAAAGAPSEKAVEAEAGKPAATDAEASDANLPGSFSSSSGLAYGEPASDTDEEAWIVINKKKIDPEELDSSVGKRPARPDRECCGEGCARCVDDIYDDRMSKWRVRRRNHIAKLSAADAEAQAEAPAGGEAAASAANSS